MTMEKEDKEKLQKETQGVTNKILEEVRDVGNVEQPHMPPQHNIEQQNLQEKAEKVTHNEEHVPPNHDSPPLDNTDQ